MLTKEEVEELFTRSGIFKRFHRTDMSLGKCGETGKTILHWLEKEDGYKILKNGCAIVELVSQTMEYTDAFFYMARACVLKRLAVQVYHIRDFLVGDSLIPTIWDVVDDIDVMFIQQLSPIYQNVFNENQKYTLSWFVERLMLLGKSAVFLHDVQIPESPFPSKLKDMAKDCTVFSLVDE